MDISSKIPQTLGDMTLGQFVAAMNYLDLRILHEERGFKDEEIEKMEYCVWWLAGITPQVQGILTIESMKKLLSELDKVATRCISDYATIGDLPTALSFECSLADPVKDILLTEIELQNEVKRVSAEKKKKGRFARKSHSKVAPLTKKLKKLKRKETFYVLQDLKQEKAGIWTRLLDTYVRQINNIKGQTKELDYIGKVLACIAWRKDESRIKTTELGEQTIDFDRIRQMETAFMLAPATKAIKLYDFFLSSVKQPLVMRTLRQYLKRWDTLTSQQAQSEKDTAKNGGGQDTLPTPSQGEIIVSLSN